MKYFDSKSGKNRKLVFDSGISNNYDANFFKNIGFNKNSVVSGHEIVIKKSNLRLKKPKQARYQSVVKNYESPMKKNSFIDPMVFKEGLSYIHRMKPTQHELRRHSGFQTISNEKHQSEVVLRKHEDSLRSEKNPEPAESLQKEAKLTEISKEKVIQLATESKSSIKQTISKPFKQAKTMNLDKPKCFHINNISAWSEEF